MLKATQDSLALSRNGFQESASLLASSKYPSSKSLPTHLKYSQRNDASGNWYTCSFGTHKPNLLAEINADRIAGLRSRTLSGHPDNAVRALMLSERLRNLEPRLRSSKAFFSSDFRLNHSRALRKIAAFLNLCESDCHNRIRGCGYDGSIRFF